MLKKVRNTFQIAFSFDIIFVLSAQEASIELSELTLNIRVSNKCFN